MEKQDSRIVFDDKVVIEYGPVYKTAVATEELLANDVTASHYCVGSPDSLGKAIVLGEPMTYIDWLGEHAWFIFKRAIMPDDLAYARGLERGTKYWALAESKPTKEEAEALALTLLV